MKLRQALVLPDFPVQNNTQLQRLAGKSGLTPMGEYIGISGNVISTGTKV